MTRAVEFNPRRDPRLLRRSLLRNLRQLPDGRFTWKYDPDGSPPSTSKRQRQRRAAPAAPGRHHLPGARGQRAESDVYGDREAASFAEALPDGRWARVESAGHNIQGDNPAGACGARFLRFLLAEIS